MELVIGLVVFISLFCKVATVSGIRISEEKCEEYRNRQPPISQTFNDTHEDAAPKEFPFMAKIENGPEFHNGILISENFVVSTAFGSHFSSGKIVVVLGDLVVGTNTDDARPRAYDVIETFVHPNFSSYDRTADIKLLKLNESVKFDEYIRPACLSADPSSIPQQLLEIGWSDTNIRPNKHLHKAKMNYISNESCKQNRPSIQTEYIREIDNGTIFCARPREGDRIICYGFYGSALINKFNGIVGIASVTFGCNYDPESLYVFVRLLAYIDWIEGIVWPYRKISTTKSTLMQSMNDFELTTERKFKLSTKPSSEIDATTVTITTPKKEGIIDPVTGSSTTVDTTTQRSHPRKPLEKKYIIVIIVTVLTAIGLLCGSLLCYKVMFGSKNRQSPVIVLLDRGNESIWLNSQPMSIK